MSKTDTLRIDSTRKKVRVNLSVFKFIDKDTKQFVVFCPALDISGYGETIAKAEKMILSAFESYFDFLTSMNANDLRTELSKLGWKKDIFRNKEFSNAKVDINGQLKNFNAVEDKVERMTLVA